jgi:hypothetical protein
MYLLKSNNINGVDNMPYAASAYCGDNSNSMHKMKKVHDKTRIQELKDRARKYSLEMLKEMLEGISTLRELPSSGRVFLPDGRVLSIGNLSDLSLSLDEKLDINIRTGHNLTEFRRSAVHDSMNSLIDGYLELRSQCGFVGHGKQKNARLLFQEVLSCFAMGDMSISISPKLQGEIREFKVDTSKAPYELYLMYLGCSSNSPRIIFDSYKDSDLTQGVYVVLKGVDIIHPDIFKQLEQMWGTNTSDVLENTAKAHLFGATSRHATFGDVSTYEKYTYEAAQRRFGKQFTPEPFDWDEGSNIDVYGIDPELYSCFREAVERVRPEVQPILDYAMKEKKRRIDGLP